MEVMTRRSRNSSRLDQDSTKSLCPYNIPVTWDLPRVNSLAASVKPKSPGDNPISPARHDVGRRNMGAQAPNEGYQQGPVRSAYEFSRQFHDTYGIFIIAIDKESISQPNLGLKMSPGTFYLMPFSLMSYPWGGSWIDFSTSRIGAKMSESKPRTYSKLCTFAIEPLPLTCPSLLNSMLGSPFLEAAR